MIHLNFAKSPSLDFEQSTHCSILIRAANEAGPILSQNAKDLNFRVKVILEMNDGKMKGYERARNEGI